MKRKITLGVIGSGMMGRIHIENIYRYLHDEAELKYVVDINPEKYNSWIVEKGYNLPAAITDKDVLMNDDSVEGVIITAPSFIHGDLVLEASNKKKHVLCEKPLDYSIDKVYKIINTIKDNNTKLQVAFHRRYDKSFNSAQKMIKEGKIGELYVSKLTSRDGRGPGPSKMTPEERRKTYGVKFRGVIFDSAIHDFDMARYVSSSEVTEVYCMGGSLVNKLGDDSKYADTVVTNLKFADGSMAVIENGSTPYGYDQRAEFLGYGGNIHVNNEFPAANYWIDENGYHKGKPQWYFAERYIQAYTDEMQSFINAIRNDTPVEVNVIDGLMSVAISLAAEISIAENRPVKLSEVLREQSVI